MNVTCCPDLFFLYKINWAAVFQLQHVLFSISGEVQAMTGLHTWLPYYTSNRHEKITPFIYE
ncbi:hypothetical protein J2T16_003770 [Paenibacillus intestini]|nr:hypothetical protein [Paenibacillus intestini]